MLPAVGGDRCLVFPAATRAAGNLSVPPSGQGGVRKSSSAVSIDVQKQPTLAPSLRSCHLATLGKLFLVDPQASFAFNSEHSEIVNSGLPLITANFQGRSWSKTMESTGFAQEDGQIQVLHGCQLGVSTKLTQFYLFWVIRYVN